MILITMSMWIKIYIIYYYIFVLIRYHYIPQVIGHGAVESASSSDSSDSSYESRSDGKGGRIKVKKEKKGFCDFFSFCNLFFSFYK